MDLDAAKKGVAKMSKSEAKAQARLDIKTEMYMRNVQKVKQIFSSNQEFHAFSTVREVDT